MSLVVQAKCVACLTLHCVVASDDGAAICEDMQGRKLGSLAHVCLNVSHTTSSKSMNKGGHRYKKDLSIQQGQ